MRLTARTRALAMALTLGVTTLAEGVRADEPPPNAAVQPSQPGPGLPVRPSRPLQLDGGNAPKPLSTGLKVLVLVSVVGAGAWVWRRRTTANAKPVPSSSMSILRRVSLGMRSELILIEVDGQRLLLGVTPSSVSTLATLADPNADELPEATPVATVSAPEGARNGNPPMPIGDRFADMLEAAQRSPERARPRPAAGAPAVTPIPPPPAVSYGGAQDPYETDDRRQEDPRGPRYGTGTGTSGGNVVEGQVRGLLGLGNRE